MNEEESFDDQELTAEDLEILQAFDSKTSWDTLQETATTDSSPSSPEPFGDDELRAIFMEEANEGIQTMRRVLEQLELSEYHDAQRFVGLQRAGHKLRGTAAAVDLQIMSAIAGHIEVIAEQVVQGTTPPVNGGQALTQAVSILEINLQHLVEYGQELEDGTLIADLETCYLDFGIALQKVGDATQEVQKQPLQFSPISASEPNMLTEEPTVAVRIPSQLLQDPSPSTSFIRVDSRRFVNLEQHARPLLEQRIQIESAQAQVEVALQELHAAQTRLQQLEQLLPVFLTRDTLQVPEQALASSLVTRILHEAAQSNEPSGAQRTKTRHRTPLRSHGWDELDMERFSEKGQLVHSFRETIAAISVASVRVNTAYVQLQLLQQEYMARVALLRNDAQLMRLAPISTLIPRLQRVVSMNAQVQQQEVQFEVSGEGTEIDQDMLEDLSAPLLQLLRSCVSDTSMLQDGVQRIWFHAHSTSNEVTIEVGFSMTVQGGAVDAIRASIQQLNGTISLQRNSAGGITFLLHIPRSQGTVQCFLVRVGNQHLIVPFSQVQRIAERQREHVDVLYSLSLLLGFPVGQGPESRILPMLVLPTSSVDITVGVVVDEVVDTVELVVKPLTPYLRRPGISGSAIDGKGRVLLMVDLPELVRCYTHKSHAVPPQAEGPETTWPDEIVQRQPKVLVADDSAYLRRSLLQILDYAHYTFFEASDGMEALEMLQKNVPDVLLLDVEMPNLNGFDLLSIIRQAPELASLKVIMLTSRSSEKHMRRAFELGAHAYLIKPCSSDLLLETIHETLTQ